MNGSQSSRLPLGRIALCIDHENLFISGSSHALLCSAPIVTRIVDDVEITDDDQTTAVMRKHHGEVVSVGNLLRIEASEFRPILNLG